MAATGRRPGRMPRPEPEMWPGVSWSSSYDLTGSRGSNAVGQGAESDFDANVARSVVGPFAGVSHHDPGQVAHHGRHIGASINDERKACRLDELDPASSCELMEDRPARGCRTRPPPRADRCSKLSRPERTRRGRNGASRDSPQSR